MAKMALFSLRAPSCGFVEESFVTVMTSPLEKIKPNVRSISAYTLAPLEAPIKINQNENPFGMPIELKEKVMMRAMHHDWARYPEFVPRSLLEKLADYAGWIPEGVMAGNG